MKGDYRRLKIKIFLQILATAAITGVVGLLIKNIFIDGVLQGPFADGFVSFCQKYLDMGDVEAINFYRQLFLSNKETIMAVGFVILLLIFLGITMSRFVHYFNQISEGVDKLLEDSDQPIILKPELAAMQANLNTINSTLKERKSAAIESEQRKNDLVVYLAHDLKTPLTSVIGYLSLLQEAADMPAEQRAKYTAISLSKALRLEELINEFFDITRFNLQSIFLEEEEINLSMMLEQLVDEFYPLLASKNMKISLHMDENIVINGDRDKLARVFNNLLKNAVSYGYEKSNIDISVTKQQEGVEISFINKGNKIAEQQLSHIFEKFYRVDSARASHAGGTGLGLAIAKKIVELHQGDLTAQSTSEFTEFVVALPYC